MAITSSYSGTKPDEQHPMILQTYGEARFHTDKDLLALSYAPDGTICSIEEPGILRRWGADGRPLDRHFLNDLETLWAFSPDARWVAAACDELMIWEVASKKLLVRLDQPSWVTAVAFAPDHSLIATGHDDGSIRLWTPGADDPVAELAEHDMPISALAFDALSRQLASAGEDRAIKVWSVPSGRLIRTMAGHTDRIPGLAWHPAGRLLVSVGWDSTARVWDVQTGQPSILLNTHDDQVQLLSFSNDGRLFATADSAATVHVWGDLLAAEAIFQLPGYAEEVRSLAFRADGKRLAVGGTDRVIQIYDTESGELVSGGGLGVKRSVAMWNGTNRQLVLNAEEGLRVWSVDTGKEQPSPLPAARYLSVAASSDSRWLAGVTPDAIVHIWNRDGQCQFEFDGPKSAPTFLTFSPDSKLLLAAVSNEGTIWVWDIEKREPILLIIEATEGCSVEAITMHPNGQWLLCGGVDYLSTSGTTGNVCLWDLPTKQRLYSAPDGATCLAFDANGDRFAFATPKGRIVIADSASGHVLLDIEGRDGEVMNDLVFSPEASLLIGAARDATLRVWDSSNGELIASRQLNVPIHSLFVEPDGRCFAGNENATGCEIALARLCDLA